MRRWTKAALALVTLGALVLGALWQRNRAAVRRQIDEIRALETRADALATEYDFAAAEPLWRQALALRQKCTAADNLAVAEVQRQLGDALYHMARHPAAESAYRQALSSRRAGGGVDDLGTAQILHEFGELLSEALGKPAEALNLVRQAVAIRREHLGPEHPAVLASTDLLGAVNLELRRFGEAERLFREVLATIDRLHLDSDLAVVARFHLGLVLKETGELGEAASALREALSISRKRNGPQQQYELTLLLSMLAQVLKQTGDFDSAERAAREAVEIFERSPSAAAGWGSGMALSTLGGILFEKGDFASADALMRQSLADVRSKGSDGQVQVAGALGQLAAVRQTIGDTEAAENALREAVAIYRKTYGDAHPWVARYTGRLGWSLACRGDLDGAEAHLRDAWAAQRRSLGEKHYDTLATMSYVAIVAARKGAYAEAESLLRNLLPLQRETLPAGDAEIGNTEFLLAETLRRRNVPESADEAEQLYRSALDILRNSVNPMLRILAAESYATFLLRTRGQPATAAEHYAQAIAGVEQQRVRLAGDEIERARFVSYWSRSNAYAGMVRAQLALTEPPPTVPEPSALVPSGNQGRAPIGGPIAAFDYLERGRGRALLDLLDRSGQDLDAQAALEATSDAKVAESLEKIRANRTAAIVARVELERRLSRSSAVVASIRSPGGDELDSLRQQHRAACDRERQASRDLFELARGRLQRQGLDPLTAVEVAAALRADEKLLAYDVGPRDSLLLILDASGSVVAHWLKRPDGEAVTASWLTESIRSLLTEISHESDASGRPIVAESGHALFRTLVPEAARSQVANASTLLIVPDGPLHLLPLDCVPIGEGGELWVDRMPPTLYGPSATLLINRRRRAESRRESRTPPPVSLVALGDPEFAPRSASGSETLSPPSLNKSLTLASRDATRDGFGALTQLPGTRREVETLVELFRKFAVDAQVRVLLGNEASTTRLTQSVDRPRYLHIATHGLIAPQQRAFESALALATPAETTSSDSGFLRLADLLAHWTGKLEGTELVTLSACRTGRGVLESGEGSIALPWGFLYAGAESVVATLWKVDDRATALLMARLYENLLGAYSGPRQAVVRRYAAGVPMAKVDALYEAKRWLRGLSRAEVRKLAAELDEASAQRGGSFVQDTTPQRDTERPFADPFYWAAFVLIGDGS